MTGIPAARLGDLGLCSKRKKTAPAIEGSNNVLINGRPAVRQGDAYAAPVGGNLAAGSPTVFINGRPAGRIGDSITGGWVDTTGSPNVFIGSSSPPGSRKPFREKCEQCTPVDVPVPADKPHYEEREENIIIIGSELQYNSFWLKMMFMACGWSVAQGALMPPGYSNNVDLTTILVVDYGYTELERDRIRRVATICSAVSGELALATDVIMIKSQSQLDNFLTTRRKNNARYKIKNIVVFSHGLPGRIALNYEARPNIDIKERTINKLTYDMFAQGAHFFSYACRTGAGTADDWFADNWWKSDPQADKSLAQYIANHLQITVRAFYRRSYYGDVLRNKSQSGEISAALRAKRGDGKQAVIDLSTSHEALFHKGLANGFIEYIKDFIGKGTVAEGVNNYALWRKQGALTLPTHASDPGGFPPDFATFEPK